MLLPDSSVWVDFYNNHPSKAHEQLVKTIQCDEAVAYTGVILQEVLQGIRHARTRLMISDDFEPFVLLTPTLQTHRQAAEIYTRCRAKGITVRKSIDCLIAAIAIEHDVPVLQKDRDFPLIAQAFPLRLA